MMNESDWLGGKHLFHRKAITIVRQGGEETNWEFRGKKLVQKTWISPKCDAVLHLDHSVNLTCIGSYDGESKNGSVAYTLSRLLFKEQRETSRDDARSIVVSVKHDFTEELRHTETDPMCKIHKSRCTSRRHSRPKSFARKDLPR